MKNLKINVPEGYEIDKDKSTIVFKKKLPNTLEEYEKEWFNGFLNEYEFIRSSQALKSLYDLRNCYRQGWEPDWENADAKYCIGFSRCRPTVKLGFYDSKFLSFKDSETANLFLENFRDLIEQAKPLMS